LSDFFLVSKILSEVVVFELLYKGKYFFSVIARIAV